MENIEVALIFEEIADLLELEEESPFRIRAYRNAARVITELSESIVAIASDEERKLEDLPGIGKDLAGKIRIIIETGDLPLRQELAKKVPPGIRDMLKIPGLGPKRLRLLNKKANIQSLEDLQTAIREQRLRDIRGFGSKTEANLEKAIQFLTETSSRCALCEAKVYADALVRYLKSAKGVGQVCVAGSFRRRKETVGDLDILVTCRNPVALMDHFEKYQGRLEIVGRGPTKMTIRLGNKLQVDIRVVPDECYGAALLYFTGSKQHNIVLRRIAQAKGLKLSEYGLFRGKRVIASRTEEDIYSALKLSWIPPELREGRDEIDLALEGKLPSKLIEVRKLKGDLHVHTKETDGRASMEEMVLSARSLGYAYIAITDHSKRVSMAKGLNGSRLLRQWTEIEKLAKKIKGIKLLKGVELDILEDGSLDLPDKVISKADWVIAAVHYGQKQSRRQITDRIIGAIKNPYVSAIAHPTGRLINVRDRYDVDLESVMRAAAEHKCALELNSQPSRLDLDDLSLREAKRHGVQIVINSDAHSVEEMRFVEFGVDQARRAGLTVDDILNSRTWEAIKKQLGS